MNKSGAMPSSTYDCGAVMSTAFFPVRRLPDAAMAIACTSDWHEPRPIRST